MSETLNEVDEIAKDIPEVAPPGWGHTKADKKKGTKVGGSAHEFDKDLKSGKFKGLPGDKTAKDKKASMFKLMWSMKNKKDKPHYKPGVKDKLKSQYKEEVQNEWGDTSILSKQSARIAGRPDIGSMDNKPHRKLKITQKGLDALRTDRDRPKVKTQVKITKKGREALKKEEIQEPDYEKRGKKNISAAERKREQDKRNKEYFATQKKPSVTKKKKKEDERNKEYFSKDRLAQAAAVRREGRFASTWSDPRTGGSSSVDTVPDYAVKAKKGAISAPGSGSIAKAKKAKASDVNKSIEQQMKDAMKESFQRIREAQWKIKLRGLPSFYVPGKSAGAVRQMLRKQLKRPMDDIEDIVRATPAAKKKDFRDRAQGQQDSAVGSGKDK